MKTKKYKFIVFLGFFSFFSSPVLSAVIKISPMQLEISQDSKTAVLTLTNAADEPVVLQMEAKEWKQENGKDNYLSTKDVIITPPLVRIGPQEKQIVRLSMRKQHPTSQEVGYRLFLDEIPQPSSKKKPGIQTILSISLPLFVKPAQPIEAIPSWSISRVDPSTIRMSLLNKGSAHLKVTKVRLQAKNNTKPIVEREVLDYILPTKEKGWEFALPKSFKSREIILCVETNQGELSEHLSLP